MFLQCSKECGTGVQTRKVYCQTGTGYIVHQARCDQTQKPNSQRKCFEKACKLTVKLTQESVDEQDKFMQVKWLSGAWGEVNISFRFFDLNINFYKNVNGKTAQTFLQFYLLFSFKCSRTCGHGHRERFVACVSNNAVVTDSYCDPVNKPIRKELCNSFPCPFWRHGAWSKVGLKRYYIV